MTLVILAGGIGSRFGALKQIYKVGPNDEFIMDYSIFDAINAGFTKVVFVIKKEMYHVFKETIEKRIKDYIEVSFVFQDIDNVLYKIDYKREKPWGTGHALLSAKNEVKENFAVINADDFYGKDAYKKAYNFLKNNINDNLFGLIGYSAINTLSENGSVKRGVLFLNKNNKLVDIIESKLKKLKYNIHCISLENNKEFDIEYDRLVSMNMILFTPKIFEYLKNDFIHFLKNINDKQNSEFLLPTVLDKHIKSNDISVEVIETSSKWYGMTYKKDAKKLKIAINKMIENNEYNSKLWS